MNEKKFKNPKFIKTAVKADGYPLLKDSHGSFLPEIAVAGRSNVGKSTLLNHLFGVKGLVKTSSTPGKTQALNFFTVDDQLVFVDLPGYGFADVPLTIRKKWGPLVQGYLSKREQLKLILFLFDIRRTPNAEDMEFLEWAAQSNKAVILVLTKVDKVNQSEKARFTKEILKKFDTENLHFLHYSAMKNLGRKELLHMVFDALKEEELQDNGISG